MGTSYQNPNDESHWRCKDCNRLLNSIFDSCNCKKGYCNTCNKREDFCKCNDYDKHDYDWG